ncbi:MAG: DUF2142 domain-containing protein, partial [Streptococcaceae bacterium]|nr:DUF2142 domain-containing protein [Streptococcaceae bacterium]
MLAQVRLQEMKIEKIYLLLILIFGSLFLIVQPVFSAPDEGTHFRNAYNVFHGPDPIPSEDPRSFQRYVTHTDVDSVRDGSFIQKYYITKGDFRKNPYRININQNNIQYLPQALGLLLGQLIYPSFGIMITLARIFQLA